MEPSLLSLPSIARARDGSACVIVIIRDVIRLTFFFIFGRLCNGCVIGEAWLDSYGLIPWFELHLTPLHANLCLLFLKKKIYFRDAWQKTWGFLFSSYEFWKTFTRMDPLPSKQTYINFIITFNTNCNHLNADWK